MTKTRIAGVLALIVGVLVAFQNCSGGMKASHSDPAVVQASPENATPEQFLKSVQTNLAYAQSQAANLSNLTAQQIQTLLATAQLLLSQVQTIDLSKFPNLQPLQQQLVQELTAAIQLLQTTLANLPPPANTNPPAGNGLPCDGTFLISFSGGTPIPTVLTQKTDGTFQFSNLPIGINLQPKPIVNTCANGMVTTGFIYQGLFWSMKCEGTYTETNNKTQITGKCAYVGTTSAGGPGFPDAQFSAIEQ